MGWVSIFRDCNHDLKQMLSIPGSGLEIVPICGWAMSD